MDDDTKVTYRGTTPSGEVINIEDIPSPNVKGRLKIRIEDEVTGHSSFAVVDVFVADQEKIRKDCEEVFSNLMQQVGW